ncbi:ABC transporter ATP-binding protein [Gammaproteobacteria bacterium]|nr:ABC transporter ATP-binding protein [Gammaproteobacteria bacterium]
MSSRFLLEVNDLSVFFHTRNGLVKAVNDVSFNLKEDETLAIVGESGSGKSMICHAIMGLLTCPPANVESGSIYLAGEEILKSSKKRMRQLRSKNIAMIFQDPMTSLNPFLSVGEQLIEPLIYHSDPTKRMRKDKAQLQAIKMLQEVGIENARERLNDFPHQFSGGMRQRVLIAMALIGEPQLLICDEPTTALDVSVQTQILELIKTLQKKLKIGVIFVSHDLGVVAGIADHILVLQNGHAVELDTTERVFYETKESYTKELLAAIPVGPKKNESTRVTDLPLIEVSNLNVFFKHLSAAQSKIIRAVDDISLKIFPGEILGIVGESGSGKSTLGRSILRLLPIESGEIKFSGINLTHLRQKELQGLRKNMQMIFQDPYASLNPRMTVYETLAEPLIFQGVANRSNIKNQVISLMDEVGLPKLSMHKYPHEFSGGQRQRIAIGRAIGIKPDFIVADEPVSALDVTIQSQILDLILDLVGRYSITMLFISHDLSVIRSVTDQLAVMKSGKILERGKTEELWANPKNDYTKNLLNSIPIPDPKKERARLMGRAKEI